MWVDVWARPHVLHTTYILKGAALRVMPPGVKGISSP